MFSTSISRIDNPEGSNIKNKLSRRDFLKLTGITTAGLALSACGIEDWEKFYDVGPDRLGLAKEQGLSCPTW